MKKLIFAVAYLFTLSTVFGQVEKSVDSKITQVTVFLNKAQVTREAKARIEPGKTELIFSGLTSQLDPSSIQVAGKGNFIIMGMSLTNQRS